MSRPSRTPTASAQANPPAGSAAGELTSAEAHFEQDITWLDQNAAGWDRQARVNSAMRRLRSGMPVETVGTLFGPDVLASAELRLATQTAGEFAGDMQRQLDAVAAAAVRRAPAASTGAVARVRAAVAAATRAVEAVRQAAQSMEDESVDAASARGAATPHGGTARQAAVASAPRAKRS